VDDRRYIISKTNRELVFHDVGDKDDLFLMSLKYSVRPSDMRMWNNISYGRYPSKGEKLSVWLTKSKYVELYGLKEEPNLEKNEESIEQKELENKETNENTNNETILTNKENRGNEKPTVKREEKEEIPEKKKTNTTKDKNYQVYTVKSGDNLAEVADEYDVTIKDIQD
jgi:LysM repeat protein